MWEYVVLVALFYAVIHYSRDTDSVIHYSLIVDQIELDEIPIQCTCGWQFMLMILIILVMLVITLTLSLPLGKH